MNCQKCRERTAAWQRANRDRRKVVDARYAQSNGEKMRLARRAWQEAHPEEYRLLRVKAEAARRARTVAATIVPFTPAQLEARLSVYARCWVCSDPEWSQVDHVKPLAKGGPHMLANLRPICRPCNLQKSATWPLVTTRTGA